MAKSSSCGCGGVAVSAARFRIWSVAPHRSISVSVSLSPCLCLTFSPSLFLSLTAAFAFLPLSWLWWDQTLALLEIPDKFGRAFLLKARLEYRGFPDFGTPRSVRVCLRPVFASDTCALQSSHLALATMFSCCPMCTARAATRPGGWASTGTALVRWRVRVSIE